MRFIDLHGHYAWDIDDGIENRIEAIKAIRKANQQNINTIVATPHMECGKSTQDDKDAILHRLSELKKLGIRYDVNVKSGCELMLNEHIDETLKNDLFIPIEGTQYILCEYDVRKINTDFMEVFDIYIRNIIDKGYKPIVAHVERYFHEDIDLDYVRFLIELGCVIQINTTNVLGIGNPQHHKNAIQLLDAQLVHVIASDTHRADNMRSPNMKDCFEYMFKNGYQERYINLLQNENPKRILQNRDVFQPKFKKQSKLLQFLHRI